MRIHELANKEPITEEHLAAKKECCWIRKLAKKEPITEEELAAKKDCMIGTGYVNWRKNRS